MTWWAALSLQIAAITILSRHGCVMDISLRSFPGLCHRRTACSCWKAFVPQEGYHSASALANLWPAADVAKKWEELVAGLSSGAFWENLELSNRSANSHAVISVSLNTQLLFVSVPLTHGGGQGYFCELKRMVMKTVLMLLISISFFMPSPSVFLWRNIFQTLFQLLNATFSLNYTPWYKAQNRQGLSLERHIGCWTPFPQVGRQTASPPSLEEYFSSTLKYWWNGTNGRMSLGPCWG